MYQRIKCCLCAVFMLLLMLPSAAFADNSDLEALSAQIGSAESINSQLALIGEAAELFNNSEAYDNWDISLNAAPAGELPEGMLPDSYDEAQSVDALPDDLKEGRILALYDDEGSISLLGNFMARFSSGRRASSLDDAEIMLVFRHQDVARTDYIGSAYDRRYYGYIWRIGSANIYEIFYRNNNPPFSGMGVLYGSSMSNHDLWDETRFLFFGSKVISEGEGISSTYTLMSDGWHLSDIEGDRLILEVPGEIDGEPIVAISTVLSYDSPSLQRVTLSEGVKSIENSAFQDLDSLTEVSLPESLVSIGEYAFSGCDALTELTIPENVESIGYNAFSNMSSLERLQLNAANLKLSSGAITGFNRIGSLTLPEGLMEIPDQCFQESYGLTALYIPASVVNFPDTFPEWIAIYTPANSPAKMWADKQGLTTVACDSAGDMPSISVEQEDQCYYVIYNNEAILVNTDSGIQYVILPDTLGGAPLTEIRHGFYWDRSVAYVSVPEGVAVIGNNFCDGCSMLEQVELPSTLTKIGKRAFSDCYELKTLTLPEGLQSIGTSLASGCSALTSMTFPSTVTEISEDCLQSASSLTNLIIPEGIRKLPTGMLSGCENLFSLYLPKSVVQIDASLPSQVTIFAPAGSPALMWAESNQYVCQALDDPAQMPMAEIVEEGDYEYILYNGEAMLRYYTGDTEVLMIPETLGDAPVTRILTHALSSDSLTSVTVADSVRRLDYQAFYDNDYLEELYLPDTIEYMDDNALRSIYNDCTIYTPEGSYAWDFVSKDLNCAGGHVFTLENWDHESVPVEPAEQAESTEGSGFFFPDIDALMPEPLMTYGNYAQTEPADSLVMEDGSIWQLYTDITKDDYQAYGNALGSNGYTIVESSTDDGIVSLTLALGDTQFTMLYNPAAETMEFTFPADANIN